MAAEAILVGMEVVAGMVESMEGVVMADVREAVKVEGAMAVETATVATEAVMVGVAKVVVLVVAVRAAGQGAAAMVPVASMVVASETAAAMAVVVTVAAALEMDLPAAEAWLVCRRGGMCGIRAVPRAALPVRPASSVVPEMAEAEVAAAAALVPAMEAKVGVDTRAAAAAAVDCTPRQMVRRSRHVQKPVNF